MKKVIRLSEDEMIGMIKSIINEEYTPEKQETYRKLKEKRDYLKLQMSIMTAAYNDINAEMKKLEMVYDPKLVISIIRTPSSRGDRYVGRIKVPEEYMKNPADYKRFYYTVHSPKITSEYTGKNDPNLINDLLDMFRSKFSTENWLKKINFNPDDVLVTSSGKWL
jgi:hypothetical protein